MDTLRVERWNLLSEWENILWCGKKRETDIYCQIYIIILSIKQYYNISNYYIVYGLQERCFEFNYATLYKEWQKRSGEHVFKGFYFICQSSGVTFAYANVTHFGHGRLGAVILNLFFMITVYLAFIDIFADVFKYFILFSMHSCSSFLRL